MIQFRVSGRVQGVGFRYSTAKQAKNLQVRGWVRNTPSGEVEGQATGTSESISKFIEFLNRGPSGSKVEKVHVEEIKDGAFGEGFEIRH